MITKIFIQNLIITTMMITMILPHSAGCRVGFLFSQFQFLMITIDDDYNDNSSEFGLFRLLFIFTITILDDNN